MTTNADIGFGITFAIKNGATYTNVAEVTNVTPPGFTRDAVDVTHHGSTGGIREYIPGLIDGGEATLELNWVPSATDVIVTALKAGVGDFKITEPNGVTCTFKAVVTAWNPESPIDGKMVATATFKVTGEATWAAGA